MGKDGERVITIRQSLRTSQLSHLKLQETSEQNLQQAIRSSRALYLIEPLRDEHSKMGIKHV